MSQANAMSANIEEPNSPATPAPDRLGLRRRGRAHPAAGQPLRDEGTTLMLVLVLMIIGSLIVIPLMQYSISVMRANTVLSDKTERLEGVKSGLRVALAQPVSLYQTCGAGGPSTPINLATTSINGQTISTKCYFIDYQAAQSASELRTGLVATEIGETVPAALTGDTWTPSGSNEAEWIDSTSKASETGKIWLPNLPAHGLDVRSNAGYQMPAGYPTCKVFFPGTYSDALTLTGPVYFTSGIYYFENTVTVAGGATVVAGQGAIEGCTSDQEAAFYAVNAPSTHNIGGLGATFVFGKTGRLVVDNTTASPISFQFNARYVVGDDPSAGVSIMTVNGALDNASAGIDLVAEGRLKVPLSKVGAEPAADAVNPVLPVPATTQAYTPSTLTPIPKAPAAPTNVTGLSRVTAAVVSWTASVENGSPVTGYVVTAAPGGATCTTHGATTCAFTGLTNGTAYRFAVVAQSAAGDSAASTQSAAITPGGTTTLTVPTKPNAPTALPYKASARVQWTAPSNGGAPITSYTVTANPGGQTCSVTADLAVTPTLQCDVTGLTNSTTYTFTVTATNAVGVSTASNVSANVTPLATLSDPPAVTPPTTTAYEPPAVLEFKLPNTSAAKVWIPGYVAVPQGRVQIDNPHGLDVTTSGGVLAAQFDLINDSRNTGAQTVPVGFIETVVQRKFRIVSTTSGGSETSVAVVQVNENGAYAVNSWQVQ